MTIRVLELTGRLKVGTDDLLAVSTFLEIPATSRIICLSPEHINNKAELLFMHIGVELKLMHCSEENLNARNDAQLYKECLLFALEVFDYLALLIDQLASSRNHLVFTAHFRDAH